MMIDREILKKKTNSFVRTVMTTLSTRKEKENINTMSMHEDAHKCAKLVKKVYQITNNKIDPTEAGEVISDLEKALKNEQHYPDKIARDSALEDLKAIKDMLRAPAPPPPTPSRPKMGG